MSQDHTWFGRVATSTGIAEGGWLACARRSPVSWFARAIRCQVLSEAI